MIKDKYEKYIFPSLAEARRRIQKETEHIRYQLPDHLRGIGKDRKYFIKTYGCQGNLADSEKMAGLLEAMDFRPAEEEGAADVIILNTCAVRENAENRIFGELGRIKHLKTENPDLLIVLCGCMPQEEVVVARVLEKYPHVDIVFGTHNLYRLGEYIYDAYFSKEKVVRVYSMEGKIVEGVPVRRAHAQKAWVNIMYGCDEFCSYCIVPYTRGKERSRDYRDIIAEVRDLAEKGYQEVTLLGQNVNAYGKDFPDASYTFADLLSDLRQIAIPRIRFVTAHPRDLDLRTIEVMATRGNIMPHIHLPVQSGSDRILKKMNRKYTRETYLELISQLRSHIPDIAITTDIIVGFPGETEEDFAQTLDLVRKADFEGAFTFIYSPRSGTPASKYVDDLPAVVKKQRLQELNKLVNEGYLKGNKRFEGKTVKVLVDGPSDKGAGMLAGYSEHDKLVNFPGDKSLIGKIIYVKIEKAYTWHLRGIIA
ncbi:MAG TPA: tRNA (N6-isopentenyl adenosine(37)-C2)-methylthiotransferase MiaB [Acholeplasmataceae bacterium]|jgi:tRNA-2-methylthio-N6-dimethylallyladenosine synthase|nr:tRNA (N6-isopentenyl adenosine(37)-C2)-methylthiotransferase MiaB [Acholeplasmataceae bacterium]